MSDLPNDTAKLIRKLQSRLASHGSNPNDKGSSNKDGLGFRRPEKVQIPERLFSSNKIENEKEVDSVSNDDDDSDSAIENPFSEDEVSSLGEASDDDSDDCGGDGFENPFSDDEVSSLGDDDEVATQQRVNPKLEEMKRRKETLSKYAKSFIEKLDLRETIDCKNAEEAAKSSEANVVVWKDPYKKSKRAFSRKNPAIRSDTKEKEILTKASITAPHLDFDLRKSQYEMARWTAEKLTGHHKESAQERLLLELGAKPRKNECINYKDLQNRRKHTKALLEKHMQSERNAGVKMKKKDHEQVMRMMGMLENTGLEAYKATSVTKRKKNEGASNKRSANVRLRQGQIGKFKDGVQVLSKKEISKVSSSSKKRRTR